MQASLGYYINPLISILLGILIMKETLTKLQYISIGFALVGVLYMTFSYGVFPWISLLLAFSFAFYGLLKKKFQLDSLNSLLVEAIFFMPIMMGGLLATSDTRVLIEAMMDYRIVFLLLAGGVVTVVPLILFFRKVQNVFLYHRLDSYNTWHLHSCF